MRLSALDDLYTLFCRRFGGGRGFGFTVGCVLVGAEDSSEVDFAERIIKLVIRLFV